MLRRLAWVPAFLAAAVDLLYEAQESPRISPMVYWPLRMLLAAAVAWFFFQVRR